MPPRLDLGRELGGGAGGSGVGPALGGRLRVTVFQLDSASGRKSRVKVYVADDLASSAARDRVAREIAAAILYEFWLIPHAGAWRLGTELTAREAMVEVAELG